MGKRGPKPQPSALRLLRGNPGRRPFNQKEPKLDSSRQEEIPDTLREASAQEWCRLHSGLVEAGVLTVGDEAVFEQYCYALGELLAVQAAIRELPIEAAIMKGLTKRETGLRQQFMQLSDRLGLNPSARSGVKSVEPKKEESKLKKYLAPARSR